MEGAAAGAAAPETAEVFANGEDAGEAAGRSMSATSFFVCGSRCEGTGVPVRHSRAPGLVSAQAGSATRVARFAQSPP